MHVLLDVHAANNDEQSAVACSIASSHEDLHEVTSISSCADPNSQSVVPSTLSQGMDLSICTLAAVVFIEHVGHELLRLGLHLIEFVLRERALQMLLQEVLHVVVQCVHRFESLHCFRVELCGVPGNLFTNAV